MNANSYSGDSPTNFQALAPKFGDPAIGPPTNIVGEKEFDAFAQQYESALNEGLSISGESAAYFAQKRIAWIAKILSKTGPISFDAILDFGCGVGIATPLLQAAIEPATIWGFDPSTAAIARAKREFASHRTRFTSSSHNIPPDHFDLAYCNGVFHHILPDDRPAALQTVYRALKPGGWFAFWENNPWNPGTRLVMSKIPFDRDAVVISPTEAKTILRSAGFHVARFDAWFLFPKSLSWLRPIEHLFHRLPLGAQYLVLAQKPT